MSDAAIEVTDLRKSFKDVHALAGIDLEAPAGTVLGLLGPNGAGKTTAVRILTTLLPPDGGSARVAGLDVVTGRGRAALADRPGRPVRGGRREPDRAREPGDGRPALPPGPRATRASERTSCSSASTSPTRPRRLAKTYSGGMRRRLDLAAALVARPPVHLPRRADDRARPAQPAVAVGDDRGARRRRDDRAADDAVPRRGRPPRRPDRGDRPRPGDRRGHVGRAEGPRRRRAARGDALATAPRPRPRSRRSSRSPRTGRSARTAMLALPLRSGRGSDRRGGPQARRRRRRNRRHRASAGRRSTTSSSRSPATPPSPAKRTRSSRSEAGIEERAA